MTIDELGSSEMIELESTLERLMWEERLSKINYDFATAVDTYDARRMVLGMYQYLKLPQSQGLHAFDTAGISSDSAFVAALGSVGLLGRVFLLPPHLAELRNQIHDQFGLGGLSTFHHPVASEALLDCMPTLGPLTSQLKLQTNRADMVETLLRFLSTREAIAECFTFLEMTRSTWKHRIRRLFSDGVIDLGLAEIIPFYDALQSEEFQELKDSFNKNWRRSLYHRIPNFNDALAIASLVRHVQNVNSGGSRTVVFFYSGSPDLSEQVATSNVNEKLYYELAGERVYAVIGSEYLKMRASIQRHVEVVVESPDLGVTEPLEVLQAFLEAISADEKCDPVASHSPLHQRLINLLRDYRKLTFIDAALAPVLRDQLVHGRGALEGESALSLLLPIPEAVYDDFLSDFEGQVSEKLSRVYTLITRIGKFERSIESLVKVLHDKNAELLPRYGEGLVDAVRLQHLFLSHGELEWVRQKLRSFLVSAEADLAGLIAEISIGYVEYFADTEKKDFSSYSRLRSFVALLWILDGKDSDQMALDLLKNASKLETCPFEVDAELIAFGHRAEEDVHSEPYESAFQRLISHLASVSGKSSVLSNLAVAFALYRRAQKNGKGIQATYDFETIQEAIAYASRAYALCEAWPPKLYALNLMVFYQVQPLVKDLLTKREISLEEEVAAVLRERVKELQLGIAQHLSSTSPLFEDTIARVECVLGMASNNETARGGWLATASEQIVRLLRVTKGNQHEELSSLHLLILNKLEGQGVSPRLDSNFGVEASAGDGLT